MAVQGPQLNFQASARVRDGRALVFVENWDRGMNLRADSCVAVEVARQGVHELDANFQRDFSFAASGEAAAHLTIFPRTLGRSLGVASPCKTWFPLSKSSWRAIDRIATTRCDRRRFSRSRHRHPRNSSRVIAHGEIQTPIRDDVQSTVTRQVGGSLLSRAVTTLTVERDSVSQTYSTDRPAFALVGRVLGAFE